MPSAYYQRAFERAVIGMALVAPDGRCLRVNHALCAFFGYDEAELLDTTFRPFAALADRDEDRIALDRLLSGAAEAYDAERPFAAKDGRALWVHLSAALQRDETGAPDYLIVQFQDVGAQRHARSALRLLNVVAAVVNEAKGLDEAVRDTLGAICAYLGWPVGHLLLVHGGTAPSLASTDIWHLDEPERYEALRAATERADFARDAGFAGRALASGSPVWSPATAETLADRAGAARTAGLATALAFPILVGGEAVAVIECFSPLALAVNEDALHLLAQTGRQLGRVAERGWVVSAGALAGRLRRSNRDLLDFAAVASHDLQEPLRKIQSFGDRLATRYGETLGDDGRNYLARMLDAAGRMRTLIDSLLALARVDSAAIDLAPVDLGAIARDVTSDLEAQLAATGGRVEVGPLPIVEADATQMRQLLQNLIGNALKFARAGVAPVVAVREVPLPGQSAEICRLEVADNGIGFEEQYRERIFEVFERLHGRGTYAGTGIGLAICRKITVAHGGTIVASSTPGVGATFTITLPLSQPKGEPTP